MTIFIDRELEGEIQGETPPPRVGVEITRKKRETAVPPPNELESYPIRVAVPDGGATSAVVDLEFPCYGLEIWNSSFCPVLVQLQNFRLPSDVATRYDWRIAGMSYATFPLPDEYAKLAKIGYQIVGLHEGIQGVVTFIVHRNKIATSSGSLVEGVNPNFDVYENDVPADSAWHTVNFSEYATAVKIASLPNGANPANTAQMLSVEISNDPNGLAGSTQAPTWNNAFTLGQGAAAGVEGGSESFNGLVTAIRIMDLGTSAGRASIRVLAP